MIVADDDLHRDVNAGLGGDGVDAVRHPESAV